jgi:hypothetical protein
MSAKRQARNGPLHVGVTGHRPNRMSEQQWDRVKSDLAKVMQKIEVTYPVRRFVLLSGLAEGADRLAAFVAIGRGWRLRAILAFHRARFQEDFPGPFAVGEFRALLKASDKVEEPKKGAHLREPPEARYHAVGQRLLELSDVLIAIWDGKGSRGRGGTVEVLQEARRRGIPVIWLHANKPQRPRWLMSADRIGGRIARSGTPLARAR